MRCIRTVALALTCTVAALLAACSSGSDLSYTPPTSTAIPSVSGANPTPPAGSSPLTALLQRGIQSLQSAHVTLDLTLGNTTVHGVGTETLASGKVVTLEMNETFSGVGHMTLLVVGDIVYARLPASLNTSKKPWVYVSTDSADPLVQNLSLSLTTVQTATALPTFSAYAQAAKTVTAEGSEKVGDIPATHYHVVVSVAQLPDTLPGKSALHDAHISTFPIDLWLDSKGRPVKAAQDVTIKGERLKFTMVLSKLNQKVSIKAPPVSEVSGG